MFSTNHMSARCKIEFCDSTFCLVRLMMQAKVTIGFIVHFGQRIVTYTAAENDVLSSNWTRLMLCILGHCA